jgi:hypothetical protein
MTETLIHTGDILELQRCALYRGHRCAVVQAHHICPKSWFLAAGKPVDTPMITLCPSCHMNIHAALNGLIAGWDVRVVPLRCRTVAQQGLKIAEALGLTPAPTL